PPLPVSIVAQKAAALSAINAAAAGAVQIVSSAYPQFEIDTWDAQESEARAWLADNEASTPTLAPIAAARGITLADLASRVVAKAEMFRPLVAHWIGVRQALEDQLDATTDAATI